MMTKEYLVESVEHFIEDHLFQPLTSRVLEFLKEWVIWGFDNTGECDGCPRRYPEGVVDISMSEDYRTVHVDVYQPNGLRVEKISASARMR